MVVAATTTNFPSIGTNLTFTPGLTKTRIDSNSVITTGGASNIWTALAGINASFGGVAVSNISTDTPIYLAVTSANGGTNYILSITETHLTNVGSWLSGKGLFDAAGLASTLTGNLSNTAYATIGASFGSNNILIANASNWSLTVFAPTNWVETVFAPSNWVDSIFLKTATWTNYLATNQNIYLSANNTFTGSNTFQGPSIFDGPVVTGGITITNYYTPRDYTNVVIDGGTNFSYATNWNNATGTISTTADSTSVTGTNTIFLTEIAAGNLIRTDDPSWQPGFDAFVTSVESDTALTLTEGAASSGSGQWQIGTIVTITNTYNLTNVVAGLQTNATPLIINGGTQLVAFSNTGSQLLSALGTNIWPQTQGGTGGTNLLMTMTNALPGIVTVSGFRDVLHSTILLEFLPSGFGGMRLINAYATTMSIQANTANDLFFVSHADTTRAFSVSLTNSTFNGSVTLTSLDYSKTCATNQVVLFAYKPEGSTNARAAVADANGWGYVARFETNGVFQIPTIGSNAPSAVSGIGQLYTKMVDGTNNTFGLDENGNETKLFSHIADKHIIESANHYTGVGKRVDIVALAEAVQILIGKSNIVSVFSVPRRDWDADKLAQENAEVARRNEQIAAWQKLKALHDTPTTNRMVVAGKTVMWVSEKNTNIVVGPKPQPYVPNPPPKPEWLVKFLESQKAK